MMNSRATSLIVLHVLLAFYSCSGIFSKTASSAQPLSLEFCALYFAMLVVLFIYAIGWQQILKRLPLTLAFANKAVTVVWGIVWGVLIFGETVTPGMVIGALITIAGVVLYSVDDKESGDVGD